MRVANSHVFPLAKFIVDIQMKEHGITLKDLIIINVTSAKAAGYFQKNTMTICLNIGVIAEFLEKYNTEPGIEGMLRCAAAVVYEECYHAINTGTTKNTEPLACAYATKKAHKLLPELLISMGGDFYKQLIKGKPQMKEQVDISKSFSIKEGNMVKYINKIAQSGEVKLDSDTKYGHITVDSSESVTKIAVTTDKDKLNKLKESLGKTARITVEYTGLSHILENGAWTTYLDTDGDNMIVIQDNEKVVITQIRDGEDKETETTIS